MASTMKFHGILNDVFEPEHIREKMQVGIAEEDEK
jgi:hypothetical protein